MHGCLLKVPPWLQQRRPASLPRTVLTYTHAPYAYWTLDHPHASQRFKRFSHTQEERLALSNVVYITVL